MFPYDYLAMEVNTVETRRLKAFIRMVDTGSLTRAADALGIAQPALSQQVAALEADFGAQLLLRSRQGVVATPAGRSLYRHAQIILKQLDQAHIEVGRASHEISGLVHIGMPLTAAAVLSVPLLRAAFQRFPNVTLDLADGLPGNLLNEFAVNGRVDIGLLPGNVSATGIHVRPLLTERLALVASPESPIGASDQPIKLRELEGVPLVLPNAGNRVRQAVDAGFAAIGLMPTVVAEMNSVFSLCAAAAANIGSAIVPFTGARQAGHRLTVRLLIEPEIERPLYLATSTAAPLTAAAQAVYALIIEVNEDLIATGAWPGARLLVDESP
jgi:LysR family transcriptional regulator, nitrogen assimilation regulatory protein